MRWPRVRFTVRRMMVAVAVAGLALAYAEHRRREDRARTLESQFRRLARWHRQLKERALGHIRDPEGDKLRNNARRVRETGDTRTAHVGHLPPRPAREVWARSLESMADELIDHQRAIRELVAYHRAMEAKYAAAARAPLRPVAPDPPLPEPYPLSPEPYPPDLDP